jgi:RNA polymerase sigma-70 factor (ECF subfamily)
MREQQDTELAGLALQGDAEAFGVLYERHLPAIYRYVYFRVGSEAEAEDIAEETFVRAWEALPRYRLRKYPFTAWLYRIAHNLVVDYHRKHKPVDLPDGEWFNHAGRTASIEEIVGNRISLTKLVRVVGKLNEDEQQVIVLRFIEGLSHSEIAKILNKSEGASRVIQHRALASLKSLLEDPDEM